MATMRFMLKVLFIDVALCKGDVKAWKNMDSECTVEGYREFHKLHKQWGRGNSVLYDCKDGNTECQLKCVSRILSGYGTIKCEVGSKYGTYRYFGLSGCDSIYCEETEVYGDCSKCEGHPGRWCETKKRGLGICSSDGRKCESTYTCEDFEEKDKPCFVESKKGKGFLGLCSSAGGEKLQCVEKVDIYGNSPMEINPNKDRNQGTIANISTCTKLLFRKFVQSYKKKFVKGLKVTANCKDGSTVCQLTCNNRYKSGSGSGTVNCENGIYWFGELPKPCSKKSFSLEDLLPDRQPDDSR